MVLLLPWFTSLSQPVWKLLALWSGSCEYDFNIICVLIWAGCSYRQDKKLVSFQVTPDKQISASHRQQLNYMLVKRNCGDTLCLCVWTFYLLPLSNFPEGNDCFFFSPCHVNSSWPDRLGRCHCPHNLWLLDRSEWSAFLPAYAFHTWFETRLSVWTVCFRKSFSHHPCPTDPGVQLQNIHTY